VHTRDNERRGAESPVLAGMGRGGVQRALSWPGLGEEGCREPCLGRDWEGRGGVQRAPYGCDALSVLSDNNANYTLRNYTLQLLHAMLYINISITFMLQCIE